MAKIGQQEINLKIDKKEIDGGKVQLTVTVPGSAIADLINGACFALAKQYKINLSEVKVEDLISHVIKEVGEAQFNAFTNHFAMSLMTPFAINETNTEPIMEPELNTSMQITPGKDFTYVALVTLKPRYELSSYDPVTVKVPPITVTEEEIDVQIANLAQRAITTSVDEGAAVGPNSEMVFAISTKFVDTGEPVDHLTADRRIYAMGADYLPDGFDDEIMGMKAGESRTFNLDLPGVPSIDGTPGPTREVTMTIDLTQVNKKVIPAITDAWVKVNFPDAKDVEGLREMLRQQGMEYKTGEQENMKFFLVASTLAERFQGSIPDEIYEYTRGDMLTGISEQLKQQNMTLEQYLEEMGMEQQHFNIQFMMQVRETLRQSFALDALARHLKLTVTEEDIEDTLSRMAPGNEEHARAEIEGTGRIYQLTEAALRTKANKWLMDTATFEIDESLAGQMP